MATTTVTKLISRAQAISDQEDDFVTPEQWLDWATYFNKELAVMTAQLGYPYHQYDESITLNGSLQYTIDEPLAILAAYFVQPDGELTKLELMNPVQGRVLGNASQGDPKRWWVERNTDNDITISFQPVPQSGTVLILAIEMPPELDIDDSVKYPLGWEEYIVLKMARNALAKQETINPLIESSIRDCLLHIQSSAANYIMSGAPKIRNIKKDAPSNWTDPSEWLWL